MKHLNKIYVLLDKAIKLSDQDSNVETDFAATISSDIYDVMQKLRERSDKLNSKETAS